MTDRLDVGVRLIEGALLADPKAIYVQMESGQRRKMNSAVFEKIYVEDWQVTDAVLAPPFDELAQA